MKIYTGNGLVQTVSLVPDQPVQPYISPNRPKRKFKEKIIAGIYGECVHFQLFPSVKWDGPVVCWCWINLQFQGILLIWIRVEQGFSGLAVGAGGGSSYVFFLSSVISLFFLFGRWPSRD